MNLTFKVSTLIKSKINCSTHSLAAVLWRTFLDEGGEALETVTRWNDACVALLLDAERLLYRHVRSAGDRRLRRSQSYWSLSEVQKRHISIT